MTPENQVPFNSGHPTKRVRCIAITLTCTPVQAREITSFPAHSKKQVRWPPPPSYAEVGIVRALETNKGGRHCYVRERHNPIYPLIDDDAPILVYVCPMLEEPDWRFNDACDSGAALVLPEIVSGTVTLPFTDA